jgi:DNA-binding helix-hairpin-helix protein with protein kinase domain
MVQFILPRAASRHFQSGMSYQSLLKMARSAAAAVASVHSKGMVHADIHYRNFLANRETGEATLIDLDGLVVEGFLPPQVDGMLGFMAPEVIMGRCQPNENSDRYSLAVLLLHALLLRNVMQPQVSYDEDPQRSDQKGFGEWALFSENTKNTSNRPSNLGIPFYRNGTLSYRSLTPQLQKLTERALIHGVFAPKERPAASEWLKALYEALDNIVKCPHCQQAIINPYWLEPAMRRRCPFCGGPTGNVARKGSAVHA